MSFKRKGLLSILIVWFAIQSCSVRSERRMEDFDRDQSWSPERWSMALSSRDAKLKSLRSLGSVSYTERGERKSFKGVIAAERPDKIRVEAHSPFGVVWIVTYDGKELARLDARSGVRQRGEGNDVRLAESLKLPLKIGDLTAILLGVAPKRDGSPSGYNSVYDSMLRAARVTRQLGEGREQRIWFSSPEWPPIRIEEERAAETWYRVDFMRPTRFGDVLVPTEIDATFPMEQIRVHISYQTPEINPSLSIDLFQQERDLRIREIPF